ncbi:MAG: hypothetical protein NDJ72_09600, partial [Elusimicrobia bacterium]|nr:hypothetical protein [Elusimicrobiota bacterium]
MNALFALALLVSPVRAGVVMPVESGVAPAGPSAPAVPVAAPGGAGLGAPSLGSAADLRGSLPALPAPVPGLFSPVRHFVGETAAAAAASVRPEAGAVRPAPGRDAAQPGRASDRTPALPGKVSPGSPSLALSPDRTPAAEAPGGRASLSGDRAVDAPESPLVETSSLEHARPEKAAGLGRSFFDQSDEKGRGVLEEPSFPADGGPAVAATVLSGGAFGPGARYGAPDAGAAFGAGHARTLSRPSYAPEGEALHDAVASVPAAAGAASGGRAAVVMFRSAAPNGELAGARAPASAAAVPLPVLGAPRPLALDLSPSGLIVRVRSALGGALASAPSAESAPRPAVPGPSTALLERGAML